MWADDQWLKVHSGETLANLTNRESEDADPTDNDQSESGTKRPAPDSDTVSLLLCTVFHLRIHERETSDI